MGQSPRAGRLPIEARAVLHSLIRSRPDLSGGKIAAIFRARTGHEINPRTVLKERKAMIEGRTSDHLTIADHEILAIICGELALDGPVSPNEVSRQFEAMAGRKIAKNTARLFLDLAGIVRGRPGSVTASRRRLAEASRSKLAKAKVDRSERAGRRSRADDP